MTAITHGGKNCTTQSASTDNSERSYFGTTVFHNGPLGLSAESTATGDMSFTREPGGKLNSYRTNGKSYYYLTDAIGSTKAVVDEAGAKVNWYYYKPARCHHRR